MGRSAMSVTVTAVILRAYRDTLESMGGKSFLLPLTMGPLLGFAIHYATAEQGKVMEEIHLWLVYGLAATGALWTALFLFNLNMAPYRIERDRRVELELTLDRIPKEVIPDTRILELDYNEEELQKLTQLASIGAVKVWGRGKSAGPGSYRIDAPVEENRVRLIESLKKSQEGNLREIDIETLERASIIRVLEDKYYGRVDLFSEGINALAKNHYVGMGATVSDLRVNRKQVELQMSLAKI